jgi:hypothetical protein
MFVIRSQYEWNSKCLVLPLVVVVLLLALGIMTEMGVVAVIWKYPIKEFLNVTNALLVITWRIGNLLVLLMAEIIDQ